MYSPDFESASPGAPMPLVNVPPPVMTVMTPATSQQAFQSALYQRPGDRVGVIGAGARGSDWLPRILMALQCPVPEEVRWAVAALLEVSSRQPEALKDGAAKSALRQVVQVALDLWAPATQSATELDFAESAEAARARATLSETLLILRNACLDAESAQVVGQLPAANPLLVQGLHLPSYPVFGEIRGYILEIAEHITFHLNVDGPEHPLFTGLAKALQSEDRAALISTLRALARLSVHDTKNCVSSLPLPLIHRLLRLLLVDDDELVSATLDLLYQYIARLSAVSELFSDSAADLWVRDLLSVHLVRLLTAKMEKERLEYVRLPRRFKRPAPAEPPQIPSSVLDELLAQPEPARATNWIRASYEPDVDGEVTQISLWKAYESQFESHARTSGRRLLPAVDFIKNVTSAFRNAAAMVVNVGPNQKKFVIKGIRPREQAVSPSIYRNDPSVLPDTRRRVPPPFGATAAMVLQNIARLQGGRALLRPLTAALLDAANANPKVLPYIDELLVTVDA